MSMSNDELDQIFAGIRDETAHPSAALKAQMLADAKGLVPRQVVVSQPLKQPSGGWLDGLAAALGGWMAVGGLTACLGLGVTVGSSPQQFSPLFSAAVDEQISLSLSLGDTLFAEVTH